jgi:hypothetical protein
MPAVLQNTVPRSLPDRNIDATSAPSPATITACSYYVIKPAPKNDPQYAGSVLQEWNGSGWSNVGPYSNQTYTYYNSSASARTTFTFRTMESACGATTYSNSISFQTGNIVGTMPPIPSTIAACNYYVIKPAPKNDPQYAGTVLQEWNGSGWSNVGPYSNQTYTYYNSSASTKTTYTYRVQESACGATTYSNSISFMTGGIVL